MSWCAILQAVSTALWAPCLQHCKPRKLPVATCLCSIYALWHWRPAELQTMCLPARPCVSTALRPCVPCVYGPDSVGRVWRVYGPAGRVSTGATALRAVSRVSTVRPAGVSTALRAVSTNPQKFFRASAIIN